MLQVRVSQNQVGGDAESYLVSSDGGYCLSPNKCVDCEPPSSHKCCLGPNGTIIPESASVAALASSVAESHSSSPASQPPASSPSSQSSSTPASQPPSSGSSTPPASETAPASQSQPYSSQAPPESSPQSQSGPGGVTHSQVQGPTYPGSPTGHHVATTVSSGVTLTVTYAYGSSSSGQGPTVGGPGPGNGPASSSGSLAPTLAGSDGVSSFAGVGSAVAFGVIGSLVVMFAGAL